LLAEYYGGEDEHEGLISTDESPECEYFIHNGLPGTARVNNTQCIVRHSREAVPVVELVLLLNPVNANTELCYY